jgi:hypothetical protein
MADTFSDIAKNASSMSVTELGSSLLGRKEATQKAQNKRDRKDARIAQVLGVLTAGQGLFKNAFNRRQKELANFKTLDLLNNEADAKEISNISSIINVIPKDFTKAIDPTTGLPYTVEKNTDRFFLDQAQNEAFTDKLSPIIDQQIKFSADANMAVDNPSKYQIVKERAAREIFKDMIKGDKHITFLEGLEELYVDKGYTRDELLQQGLGITAGSLNSLKTSRYAKMERELKNRPGLFNPKTYLNIFKSIGKDKEDSGELNIFQSLTEKDLSAPKMTEVLDTMNLKGIVIPAFDKAMAQARLSPDRYLAKVRSPKYENQRANMSSVVLINLNYEIGKGKSFEKYGLHKYIDNGTMDDMASHISQTEAVKRTFETRAVGLSERLKYDKAFGITLYKEANPNATPLQLAEFAEDLKTTEFRNKFSALAVLKAGIVDKFGPTEEWAPSANTKDGIALAMRDISKVSQTQFDKDFEKEYGVSAANMADKIDPLISPMFTKTGQVTPEYHALPSKAGKIIAYDMQVNMVLNSTLNEQQQGERLEKFFNVTPNPRGAPDVESYIVAMQNDSKVLDTNSNNLRYLSPSQRQMYNMNLSYISKAEEDIAAGNVSGRDFTGLSTSEEGSPKDIRQLQTKLEKFKASNIEMLNNPQGAQGLQNQIQRVTDQINSLTSRLPLLQDNLAPTRYQEQLKNLEDLKNKELDLQQQYKQYGLDQPEETSEEETGTEPVTLDITKPRAVGEDVMKAAINAVVDIQGVSDEYKQTTKNFLGYVAKAESNYGLNENTFNNERDAWGPMQIIMSQSLAEIQRRLNPKLAIGQPIREYNELLKDNLNIDLNNITKEDLEQPVVSAAVARAYFMVAVNAIPTEPEAMADYYVDNYVRYNPKSPTYKEDREEARQNFLVNNGFVKGGMKQTLKSLLDI